MSFYVSLTVMANDEVFISGWRAAFSRDQLKGGASMSDFEVYSAAPAIPVRVVVRPGDEQFGLSYEHILKMAEEYGWGVVDDQDRLTAYKGFS